ncbi:hypothetical protein ANCCAN_08699 [Ancylostoma caninum]|uniref:Uncharacterized protein n=1 Tax=Ancylostoma caninum TaxID=29170 RepID=A0A368GLP5_ANCCA|nr:hypothetical protein ANCCAN_08699 [Ancylostoma caninum]
MDANEKPSKATGNVEEPLKDPKADGIEELRDDIVEEVDVLYVSADDDIPEIAQEVVTDGEYVEVVDEEVKYVSICYVGEGKAWQCTIDKTRLFLIHTIKTFELLSTC